MLHIWQRASPAYYQTDQLLRLVLGRIPSVVCIALEECERRALGISHYRDPPIWEI
jgi:hypothetical protein